MAKTLAENIEALTKAVDQNSTVLDDVDFWSLTQALNDHTDALNRFCDVMAGEQKVIYSAPVG